MVSKHRKHMSKKKIIVNDFFLQPTTKKKEKKPEGRIRLEVCFLILGSFGSHFFPVMVIYSSSTMLVGNCDDE